MITEPTVFILGAGASNPYGYPTAKELKHHICHEFDITGRGRLMKTLVEQFNNSPTESIDLYLSRNPQFHKEGKRIIVETIAEYEKNSPVMPAFPDKDWYSYIFNEMTSEIANRSQLDLFCENKISFITFNYDRSLEEFFNSSLRSTFVGLEEKVIARLLSHVRIHHMYGQYQPASWQQGSNYREYDIYGNWDFMAANVCTIGEEREALKDQMAMALKWLNEAEQFFFLGFGYGPENLKMLNLSAVLNESHRVYGTALNLLDQEIEKIKQRLVSFEEIPEMCPDMCIANMDCRKLLRTYL